MAIDLGPAPNGGESFGGIALTAGVVGAGQRLDGIALGGLGVGTGGRLRGLGVGGLVAMAPEATGVTVGALNGVILQSINLEDFLKIRTVNERHTGLAIGLVNYSANLKGIQIGLFNIVGNNPKWARVLPVVNAHF